MAFQEKGVDDSIEGKQRGVVGGGLPRIIGWRDLKYLLVDVFDSVAVGYKIFLVLLDDFPYVFFGNAALDLEVLLVGLGGKVFDFQVLIRQLETLTDESWVLLFQVNHTNHLVVVVEENFYCIMEILLVFEVELWCGVLIWWSRSGWLVIGLWKDFWVGARCAHFVKMKQGWSGLFQEFEVKRE